jgi:hypothetical protein
LPADYDNQAVLDSKLICTLDGDGELLSASDPDGVAAGNARLCTNAPEKSLFIDRPLASGADSGFDSIHPINIFPDASDPTVQVMRAWIEQGARREDLSPVDFATDIYPIVQSSNCGVCHYSGGVADTPEATQGAYPSIYDGSAMEVWNNLTSEGSDVTCGTDTFRVCVNDADSSLLLQNLLVGNPFDHIGFYSNTDEKDAALIRRWIVEGALFTP